MTSCEDRVSSGGIEEEGCVSGNFQAPGLGLDDLVCKGA